MPGRRLLLRSYRWARSRVTGGTLVLGYHRVCKDAVDPFRLSIEPELFEGQLRVIAETAQPMRLAEVAAAKRLPARSVTLTFDDGYADTVSAVLPLLELYGVPATVFVTTGNPGVEFWWDELARLILAPRELPPILRIGDAHSTRTLATTGDRTHLLRQLADILQSATPAERSRAMDAIRDLPESGPAAAPLHRALTEAEILQLASSPLIEIGAHSVTHPTLAPLPYAEQLREARESRATLERITGTPVTSFSYPHGSYSAQTWRALEEAGYALACCSVPDVLTRRSLPFALPRHWPDRYDVDTFCRWLNRWLAN